MKREKMNLDIFWLKDKSLEDSVDLPAPDGLAQEITDDLQTALEQFTAIAEKVKILVLARQASHGGVSGILAPAAKFGEGTSLRAIAFPIALLPHRLALRLSCSLATAREVIIMRRSIAALWLLILIVNAAPAQQAGKLAPVLLPFVEDHTLAGAVVLVADPEKVLDLEAVGWMDIAAKKAMRPDCMFWIASQSKPMACTALMILVDEGKVNVEDPVEKYLPEFKGQMYIAEKDADHELLKKPGRPMRVRDLMSHTSGLPGSTPVMRPTLDGLPLEKSVAANAMLALGSEPGKKYNYSNPGINTVGRIVEVVSKMPYEQFMDERIFKPLGMKDTTFWPNEEQVARLAKSYKTTPDKTDLVETTVTQLRYPLSDHTRHAFPGGGLFSTATDLSLFYRMIANQGEFGGKRILSEKAVAQMTTDQTGEVKANYGFGFSTGGKTVGHGGAYNTMSRWDPEHKLITVFLVQHADWRDEGKKIQPAFQKAVLEAFTAKPAPPQG